MENNKMLFDEAEVLDQDAVVEGEEKKVVEGEETAEVADSDETSDAQ